MSTPDAALSAGTVSDVATKGVRQPQTLDGRLTVLSARMIFTSLSFYFASFYFAIIFLQLINENGMWKPSTVHRPNLAFGIIEMALILVAGVIYFWGQWSGLYQRAFSRLRLSFWIAALLGVIAVIMHIVELHSPGFGLQDGGYATVFIGLEAMFTLILVISVIILLGMANRARLGLFRSSGSAVDAFGEFWGWLSALALLNFLALYVQPFFPIS